MLQLKPVTKRCDTTATDTQTPGETAGRGSVSLTNGGGTTTTAAQTHRMDRTATGQDWWWGVAHGVAHGVAGGIHTGVAVRVMLINLTAISTGFWKEGWGEEGRKDRLGLRSGGGHQVSREMVIYNPRDALTLRLKLS